MNKEIFERSLDDDKTEMITITKQHFEWLNHEVLRLGQLARQYSDQGDLLRAELKLLRHERVHDLSQLGEAQAEVTILKSEADYLKDEVEQLQNRCDFLEGKPSV